MKQFTKNAIVKKSEDFDKWYTDVILKAELADYAPVKGCMVFRPNGYALWEAIQTFMNAKFKAHGVQNAYFPIFIPMSFLNKEKEHVEGFSPELAIVTHGGGEKLAEPLAVRPTSETIMYEMYKQWTHSWRDLPIKINQWNSVVRWEKRTMLFMRSSEFLWQEGHCAHVTHEESLQTVLWALDVYQQTYTELLALSSIAGVKSTAEKFAGADKTYTLELLMPSGKALQGCTSHDLGQNFAKAFDWTVAGKDGDKLHPWQNSWGYSTRSLGGLVMGHGDDQGVILPPRVAPVQVVIVPFSLDEPVLAAATDIQRVLAAADIRVKLDNREEKTAGWKFNEWELKGVPLRLEVGQRELKDGKIVVYRRDTGEKIPLSVTGCETEIVRLLEVIQANLLQRNRAFVAENTHVVDSYDRFKEIMATTKGFLRAFWCEDPICEKRIKDETKASTRCLPLDAQEETGACILCGQPATHRWYFAQAY